MKSFLFKLPVLWRYLFSGGISTAVDLSILYILTEFFGWWYLASATVAFCFAVVVSFILHKFYTFENRDASRFALASQSALYLSLQITNVVVNTMFMYALVEWVGIHYFIAQIISAGTIAISSFFLYRFVIFHPSAPLAHIVQKIHACLVMHKFALVVAVVVSILYGSHHFLMPRFVHEGFVYKPVTYESDYDAGGYYGPRANAFFSRNEIELPSLLPILNPIIMGGLGKILGNIERAFIVSDFLFPPIIFLIVYTLFYELLRMRAPSLLFSSVFIISPLAFLLSPSVAVFAKPELLYFSSFEYPKITFPFYALALLFIFRALLRGGKKNIILGGLFLGVLFYTYLYDWAYIAAALVIAFIIFAFRRDFMAVKSCAYIGGITAVLSIPYWLNFLTLRQLPQYEEITRRIGGLEIGRHFRFSSVWKTYLRHLFWVFAIFFVFVRRISRAHIFLISLLLAYFVAVNIQIVLGFSPQPDHWYRETFLPIGLSVGMISVLLWNKFLLARFYSKTKTIKAIILILIAVFFSHAFLMQYNLSKNEAQLWSINKKDAEAYEWLSKNTPPGSMIASINEKTNRDIALFTHNVPLLPSGGTTLISNEELWERANLLSIIWGFSNSEFESFARKNGGYIFHDYYRSHTQDAYFKEALPHNIPERDLAQYMTNKKIFSVAPNYLFVLVRENKNHAQTGRLSKLSLVYNVGDVRIYRYEAVYNYSGL